MSESELVPREIESLAGPARRVFFRIADLWSMTDDEQMRVLGIANAALLKRWREGDPARLGRDELIRISHVFGIFKAINNLLPDPARANAWIRAPNKGPLFAGRSAIELIASGNLGDLAAVHRYLDAQLSV